MLTIIRKNSGCNSVSATFIARSNSVLQLERAVRALYSSARGPESNHAHAGTRGTEGRGQARADRGNDLPLTCRTCADAATAHESERDATPQHK